jgi:hypothetical protein
MYLAAAPTVAAVGVVLAVVILSVAVAIVIVRGSWSAKEPDQYALQVLRGLPHWLWPWRGRHVRRSSPSNTTRATRPSDQTMIGVRRTCD